MSTQAKWQYPVVRRDESIVETLHGEKVPDPYRWLEDPDAQETKEFVDAQNKVTFGYLETYPERETLRKKFTELYDFERYSTPSKKGDGQYYYSYNTGLLAQDIIYRKKSLEEEKGSVFLDPNALSKDGTTALKSLIFSDSGKLCAYAVSAAGSDWETIYVKDATKGEPLDRLEDVVEYIKFSSASWTKDEKGFFYSRFPEPSKTGDQQEGTETGALVDAKVYYHLVGTKQADDILVHKDEANPTFKFYHEVSKDGKYVIMYTSKDTGRRNKLHIAEYNGDASKLEFKAVSDDFSAEFGYLANEGTFFYLQSNLDAPRNRIVMYDLANPSAGFVDVIPQKDEILEEVHVFDNGKKAAIVYSKDVKSFLYIYDLSTGKEIRQLDIPVGTVAEIRGRYSETEFLTRISTFISQGTIYKYKETAENQYTFDLYQDISVGSVSSEKYETKQVFYTSKDGTKVPMFIIAPKDFKQDGTAPCYLYGYGGFSISLTPQYSPNWIAFPYIFDGICAIPNLRGGGEYGEEWHQAGTHGNKQNVFDDFQYAAKYLVENKYTNNIAINGGSNGGLLVGATINQAPKGLIKAAVADVGVLDMLRFHRFTVGEAWIADYSSPDIADEFKYIRKYSPLHNVRTVPSDDAYPATMLTTADHDDRVVPLHSLKMIAEMQYKAGKGENPLLIRVDVNAGHGAGKPTAKKVDELVDRFSFISLAMNLKPV